MRNRSYLLMGIICTSLIAACTDNGDDTPVEAKGPKKEIKTSNASNEINSLLKEV